jgi:hypothetical protein
VILWWIRVRFKSGLIRKVKKETYEEVDFEGDARPGDENKWSFSEATAAESKAGKARATGSIGRADNIGEVGLVVRG